MHWAAALVLLTYVLQFSRHGHRTPYFFYPNDPYKDLSFWEGLDAVQLTKLGKRQTFELGQYTNVRYSKFLPKNYNRLSFFAQTTDVDRTHMSAQTLVYGLFPATGDQVWLEGVNWQPIPIHPIDGVVLQGGLFPQSCDAYFVLRDNLLKSPKYQAIDEKYSSVYKYLTEHTGETTADLMAATYLYYNLVTEETFGYKLPNWTESVYPEPLRTMSLLAIKSLTETTEMKRMVAGPILKEIVDYLEAMAKNSTSFQKFRLISCGDLNTGALLNSFEALDANFPQEFASSLYIELHLSNRKAYVEVYFLNGESLKRISVNGCKLKCPLLEFKERLSNIIIDVVTRNSECSSFV